MARGHGGRRKPMALKRAVKQSTTFQDPEAEALVRQYLAAVSARVGGLDAATQEALRRAIADRVASLAATHGALPPRTLTLHALNSFTRPTDHASLLAEAKAAEPKRSVWQVVLAVLKGTLSAAAQIGLGPIPRIALIVVMFIEELFKSLWKRKPAVDSAAPAAVGAAVGRTLRVPVAAGPSVDPMRAPKPPLATPG